jgi:aspartyl protease family protein
MVQRPTEVAPSPPSENLGGGQGQAVAERGRDNHFWFDATINGVHMPVLFDTGASAVSLRAEDAQRLGFDPVTLRYSARSRTANGVTEIAPIMIDTITIGNITLHKVQAVVHRLGTLSENLLGQSFMSGLASYNVVQNRLFLKGH